MILQKTHLEGCSVLEPEIFTDKRGSFFESFNKNVFEELTGLRVDFIQDNQSTSRRGVLRGLHIHV